MILNPLLDLCVWNRQNASHGTFKPLPCLRPFYHLGWTFHPPIILAASHIYNTFALEFAADSDCKIYIHETKGMLQASIEM
jgi:hypothetical protein